MKKQLTIIFLTVFLYLLGFGIIIPILPILSRDFGASGFQTGLLMSIYSFMQFLFAPFWGRLSDRHGRRPILVYCLLGESLSYILFAFARNLELLFLARFMAGFFGASISTASAYISDVTPKHERSKGMALIGMAFGLGFVFGPAIGGGLAIWGKKISDSPHFDTTFSALWVAGICFSTFLFAYKYLNESLKEKNIESAKKERLATLLHHINTPTLGPLLIVFGLGSLAMSGMEATLVLYMGQKFNWTIREVSYGFAYIGLIIVFTQGFLVRRFIPKWGERIVLLMGLVLFSLGLLGIGLSPDVHFLALAMTILSIGHGMINPSVMGSVSLLSHEKEQGVALGVTQSLASFGRIAGPALGGFVFDRIAPQAPFLVSGFLGALGVTIVIKIFKHLPIGGKHDKKDHTQEKIDKINFELHELDDYRITNLLQNKIPFVLYSEVANFRSYLPSKVLHAQNIVIEKQNFNEILKDLSEKNIDKNFPLVLISHQKHATQTVLANLIEKGYHNSYWYQCKSS